MKLEYYSSLSVISYCEKEARYDSVSSPHKTDITNLSHLFSISIYCALNKDYKSAVIVEH